MSLGLRMHDRDTFHFYDASSLSQSYPCVCLCVCVCDFLNKSTELSKKGCKKMVTSLLASFLDVCTLCSERNLVKRCGSPQINTEFHYKGTVFSLAVLRSLTIRSQMSCWKGVCLHGTGTAPTETWACYKTEVELLHLMWFFVWKLAFEGFEMMLFAGSEVLYLQEGLCEPAETVWGYEWIFSLHPPDTLLQHEEPPSTWSWELSALLHFSPKSGVQWLPLFIFVLLL